MSRNKLCSQRLFSCASPGSYPVHTAFLGMLKNERLAFALKAKRWHILAWCELACLNFNDTKAGQPRCLAESSAWKPVGLSGPWPAPVLTAAGNAVMLAGHGRHRTLGSQPNPDQEWFSGGPCAKSAGCGQHSGRAQTITNHHLRLAKTRSGMHAFTLLLRPVLPEQDGAPYLLTS